MNLLQSRLMGWVILGIGVMILLNIIDIIGIFIGPILFFIFSVWLLKKHYRQAGYIFLFISVMMLLGNIFRFEWFWVLIALLMIYSGYRMFKGDGKSLKTESEKVENDGNIKEPLILQAEEHELGEIEFKKPPFPNSMVGSLYLINSRYELKDMNLSYGIGDIKIDLSKAIISEGESTIVISGFVGDVDIYVPHDLDVSIAVTVVAGYIDILGFKQGGVNRQVLLATKGYEQARRKVQISVSILLGDINVRYL